MGAGTNKSRASVKVLKNNNGWCLRHLKVGVKFLIPVLSNFSKCEHEHVSLLTVRQQTTLYIPAKIFALRSCFPPLKPLRWHRDKPIIFEERHGQVDRASEEKNLNKLNKVYFIPEN